MGAERRRRLPSHESGVRRVGGTGDGTDRGQVSLSVVEAGIGVVLVLAVTATMAMVIRAGRLQAMPSWQR